MNMLIETGNMQDSISKITREMEFIRKKSWNSYKEQSNGEEDCLQQTPW